MSRLIVRGLPSYLTDARLREHFSQKGAVTDVKLMRRPDGTSRKFGFVGYRSEEEARQALDYFNCTFIDTARISIEFAKKIGDEELAKQREDRRNRRTAGVADQGGEEGRGEGKKRKFDKADGEDGEGQKKRGKKGGAISFEEFMSVVQPKAKRKAWQNEDALPEQTMEDITAPVEKLEKKAEKKAKKAAAAEAKAQKDEAAAALAEEAEEEAEAELGAAANDVGLTDEEYMRLRMKHKVGTDLDKVDDETTPAGPQFEQSDDEKDDADNKADESDSDSEDKEVNDAELERKQAAQRRKAEAAAAKDQKIVDQIMESGRLFVRNLPFAASEDEVQSFFESFGSVKQVHIPLDKQTKTSKGLAFISFTDPAHALAAFRAKDGSTFQGRLLHLLPAVNKKSPTAAEDKKPATLKQARADAKKQEAGKDFNWSMLYMSSDAVASSIADRLGVSKADILNPGAEGGPDNAAVPLALAETRIIQETKEFFTQQGINVDAFNCSGKVERSITTMLVKNIPYGTSVEEVQKLFEEFGEVDKVLIPPSGTIAIVEMSVEGEAKVAFRAIAYKRFKGGILYLEKAPVGLLDTKKAGSAGEKKVVQAPIKGKTIDEASNPSANIAEGEDEAVDGATLYVKNLSFSTTDERLASTFHGLNDYAFARVQTKPDPRRPGARLSMGYAFIGFKSIDAARTAQKTMNGKVLDGHTLVVTFARRNAETTTTSSLSSSANGTTKILVKNLPFEATKKDIRDLFSSQGQVKSVRLPKKFDNSTRGFAFVEYTTVREAQSAMEALKHTHLLGRHLVLQWSKTATTAEEEVEMQRNKTKIGYVAAGEAETLGNKQGKIKLSTMQINEAVRKARSRRDDVEDEE